MTMADTQTPSCLQPQPLTPLLLDGPTPSAASHNTPKEKICPDHRTLPTATSTTPSMPDHRWSAP